MQQKNMLPVNAFYITCLRDKRCYGRPESKRINKRTGEIISKTQMDHYDFIIYVALLSRADAKTLTCFPSIDQVASDYMHVERRTVWEHLQDLEQMQFIAITKKRGKPNVYFMRDFAEWSKHPHY